MVTFLPDQRIGPAAVLRILRINPNCHFIIRPYQPGSYFGDDANIPNFVDICRHVMDDYAGVIPDGQAHMQLYNEPNMPRWAPQWEGFGDQLVDMQRYNENMLRIFGLLRITHPRWFYGIMALTIGNRDAWLVGSNDKVTVGIDAEDPQHRCRPDPLVRQERDHT
ncbi:unnamed protein product, partial [marine sediment metagenome]